MRKVINVLTYGTLLLLAACKAEFQPIDYGKEACVHCKMTIVDTRYAAEMVTPKGKIYKFDDVVCLKQFANESGKNEEGTKYFVADYTTDKDKFLDATKAIYLKNEFFKSPMNGNSAAFLTQEIAKHLADSLNLQPISWDNLK